MGQHIGISDRLETILAGWSIGDLPLGLKTIFSEVFYTPIFTWDNPNYTVRSRILDSIASSQDPIWISGKEKQLRTIYFIGGQSEDAIIEKLEKISILL